MNSCFIPRRVIAFLVALLLYWVPLSVLILRLEQPSFLEFAEYTMESIATSEVALGENEYPAHFLINASITLKQ